jgi:hypothetical protein
VQSGQCGVLNSNYGGLNITALSGPITPGAWCVGIQDNLGALAADETFTMTVSHP